MKSGKMFWGFFLLTLGVLSLLVKYEVIVGSFDFVWNTWPLIFVFWGLSVIFKENFIKPIVSALFGIFIALLIFGLIYSTFWGFNLDFDKSDKFTEQYSKEYEPDVKVANLKLDSGAGSFVIDDTTSNLIDAKAYGIFADYDFNYEKIDSVTNIAFQLHTKNFRVVKNKFKNNLHLKLNTKPKWNFEFNIGASKNKFDLSPFKVQDLEINTGATNSKIKLGDKNDSANVNIEMGAASLTLEIPKTVGCKIDSDLSLVSRNFGDFNKIEDGTYQTENFEKSKKKIFIKVQGGVSSFNVVRY